MHPYRTIYLTLIMISFLACLPALAAEPELRVGKFSSGDLTGWKEQTVFGSKKSTYAFAQDNGKTVLVGKSNDAASGLLYKIDIDPKNYPIIRWTWKIDHTVKKGNERIKDGHDFAARLYVVFPRGLFSRTRAIEYVWGNVLHKGESIRSPYSKNAAMIAVDSGDELAGHWTVHRRNFADDYRTAFGEEAPKAGAIAIMTDSDNTHESATGYYGDITLLQAPREDEQKPKELKSKEQQPKEPLPKEQPTKQHPAKQKEQPYSNGTSPLSPVAPPPSQNQQ